jgi:hypothetical protein
LQGQNGVLGRLKVKIENLSLKIWHLSFGKSFLENFAKDAKFSEQQGEVEADGAGAKGLGDGEAGIASKPQKCR